MIRKGYVDTSGGQCHYRYIEGQGTPIVFLHQTPSSSLMFEKLNSLVLDKKMPLLGICVGMQMLAEHSEEGELAGLGWIDASVNKFDKRLIGKLFGIYLFIISCKLFYDYFSI